MARKHPDRYAPTHEYSDKHGRSLAITAQHIQASNYWKACDGQTGVEVRHRNNTPCLKKAASVNIEVRQQAEVYLA